MTNRFYLSFNGDFPVTYVKNNQMNKKNDVDTHVKKWVKIVVIDGNCQQMDGSYQGMTKLCGPFVLNYDP